MRKRNMYLLVWALGIIFMLACSTLAAPTATPTAVPPTSTATLLPPTSTPESTATLPPPTADPGILYQDDFSTNDNGWETGVVPSDGGTVEMDVVDGQYVVTISSKREYFSALLSVPNFSAKDYIASMDVTVLDTTVTNITDGLWLSFDARANGPQYYSYSFFMGDSQFIRSNTWETKDDVILWDWTNLDALNLNKGVTNRFKFEINGSDFALYLNDEKINSATDDGLDQPGEMSFTVLLAEANQTLTIAFDNLLIEKP